MTKVIFQRKAKIQFNGSSYILVLPKNWAEINNICKGSEVNIGINVKNQLIVEVIENDEN